MKQTKRQQQERQARDDKITELRSRPWQAHDLIVPDDAILMIADMVQPRNETMGETLQRVRRIFSRAQAPKNGKLALTVNANGCLVFGELMAWVYSRSRWRTLKRNGVLVFDGLPGFHGTASGALALPVPQMTGYGYSTPPAGANPDRDLVEANLQIIDLKKQVAKLQADSDVMRPRWLKADKRGRTNRESARAPRPRKKKEE